MSSKRILGISGCKASGKSTLAQWFLDNAPRLFPGKTVRVFGFADAIKDVTHAILNIPREILWGDDTIKGAFVPGKLYTAREVLQEVSGAFKKYEYDCWLDLCLKTIDRFGSDLSIIADVRFPSEIDAINERGGIVIRLLRQPAYDAHVTERALDAFKFDYAIDNRDLPKEKTATEALSLLAKAWGWPLWRD